MRLRVWITESLTLIQEQISLSLVCCGVYLLFDRYALSNVAFLLLFYRKCFDQDSYWSTIHVSIINVEIACLHWLIVDILIHNVDWDILLWTQIAQLEFSTCQCSIQVTDICCGFLRTRLWWYLRTIAHQIVLTMSMKCVNLEEISDYWICTRAILRTG